MAIRKLHNQAAIYLGFDYVGLSTDTWTGTAAAATIGAVRYTEDNQVISILKADRTWAVIPAGSGGGGVVTAIAGGMADEAAIRALLAGTLNVNVTNPAVALSVSKGTIPENKREIAGAHTGILITGYNGGPAQYYLVFDAATVPANGTVTPVLPPLKVPADSNFTIDLTQYGIAFTTGISVCNSTQTPLGAGPIWQKTIGAADSQFTVAYL